MTAPVLSVVIPSYNGRDLLGPCLASVARNRPEGVPLEVIVVDDGSTDDTAAWLSARWPEVRVVARGTNGGFVAAVNAGIAASRGGFVQLLNNDAEAAPGWVEAGLAPFADPRVASVAPLVVVRGDPGRVDSAGDGYSWVGWPYKRGHGEPVERWSERAPEEVFGASGAAAFYRVSALREVGGFDPAFGSYYEDVDLAFRLRWAGYRCVFAPGCRAFHEVSASHDHARPELQRRMARNAELVFWGDLPLRTLIPALLPHLAFVSAQAAVRALRGRAGAFLLGKLDAARMACWTRERRRACDQLRARAEIGPRFPLSAFGFGLVRNHLRRPPESGRPVLGPSARA